MNTITMSVPVVLDISEIVRAEIAKQMPEIIKTVTAQLVDQLPTTKKHGDNSIQVDDIDDFDQRVKEIAEEVLDNYDFGDLDVDDQIAQWVSCHGDEISEVITVSESEVEDAVSNWVSSHGDEITEAVDLDKLRDAITDGDPLRLVSDALMGAARQIRDGC